MNYKEKVIALLNSQELSNEQKEKLESIFPELKESEDERIRKELIRAFNSLNTTKVWNGIERTDILAWLEKQGEKLPVGFYYVNSEGKKFYSDTFKYGDVIFHIEKQNKKKPSDHENQETKNGHKFNIGDIISNGNVEFRVDNIVKNCIGQDCYFLVNIESEKKGTRYYVLYDSKGNTYNSGEVTWLCEQVDKSFEKQVGQKPQGKSALEAAKEEKVDNQNCVKPADKVEPKFKVGDWITDGEKVWKIGHIEDDMYIEHRGTISGGGAIESIDKHYHLWTIQDAKKGDVLVDEDTNMIGIFEDIEGMCWHSKLYYSCYTKELYGIECGGNHHKEFAKPATKEQRDTLMKAMADAGYTFDFEKKELRKIEQKSADKIEPKFKVGDKIQYLKGCGTIMTIEKIKNGEYIFGNNLGHTTIEDGNKWYLVECNPTWSEKDEKIALSIEQVMNCASLLNIVPDKVDKIRTWLKSLKNRVQPKLEWSKEDEDILNTIINHFEIDLECTKNDDIIRWLKSLRPQNRWKPSDEQMKVLDEVIRNPHLSTDEYNGLIALKEQLKAL